jgi:hypothetical protein
MPTPRVGNIVHYCSYGTPGGEYTSQCRAAIVTAVPDILSGGLYGKVPDVHLCVLNPEGFFFNQNVRHDEPYDGEVHPGNSRLTGGTWHRPEQCE